MDSPCLVADQHISGKDYAFKFFFDILALQRSSHPGSPHIRSSGGNQNPRFAILAVDDEPTAVELS